MDTACAAITTDRQNRGQRLLAGTEERYDFSVLDEPAALGSLGKLVPLYPIYPTFAVMCRVFIGNDCKRVPKPKLQNLGFLSSNT